MFPINPGRYLSPDVAEATKASEPEVTDEELELEPESEPEPEQIDIKGVVENIYQVKGKKGRGKGKLYLQFRPDFSLPNPFANFAKMVSPEYWNAAVQQYVLNEATKAATKAAVGEDGMISLSKFADAFMDWFSPVTRGGVREFKDQLEEVIGELQPFLLLSSQNKPIPAADQPRFAELLAQWQDLSEKIEHKSVRGKARKVKKAA